MRLPARSARTQRWSMTVLQAGIALMAFVSLHPYFLWSHQKPAYAVATLIVIASCTGCVPALVLTRGRLLLSLAFAFFLIYLSVLPKVHGGTTRWFFLIPFTVALLHLRREDLQAAFEKFHWMFALSLVPGMVLWIWILTGLPIELRFTDPPGDIIQRGVTGYLEFPGAVFVLSNSLVLPHGGLLFRLCGMYDEPGTVGTVAALSLAATRFRFRDIKGAISFAAGAMSFSVAFAILTTVGLVATAFAARRPWLAGAALLSVIVGVVPLMGLKSAEGIASSITVDMPTAWPLRGDGKDATVRGQFSPEREWGLRNAPGVDSRAQPWMRKLLDDYRNSSVSSIFFGIASDASIVHGWGSSVWYRILTDFGIVGFFWLFALFFLPLFYLWREGRLEVPVLIFCTLFLMSFYQRPIIWLPAQLLIYFAGLHWARAPAGPAKQVQGEETHAIQG